MSERFKEKITVSAEVKTYLKDLYHQIEYELREDYDDALEKALNKIDKAIEYINNYLPNYDFDHSNLEELLSILGGSDE